MIGLRRRCSWKTRTAIRCAAVLRLGAQTSFGLQLMTSHILRSGFRKQFPELSVAPDHRTIPACQPGAERSRARYLIIEDRGEGADSRRNRWAQRMRLGRSAGFAYPGRPVDRRICSATRSSNPEPSNLIGRC